MVKKTRPAVMLTARIPAELASRLAKATRGPNAPAKTAVVIQGLRRVLKELEYRRRQSAGKKEAPADVSG